MKKSFLLLFFTIIFCVVGFSKTDSMNDVSSIDSIIKALYNVVSGPAGENRNWDRMRTLFMPGAGMVSTGFRNDGSPSANIITVETYIAIIGPQLVKLGFFETEIGRKLEKFGNMAHVYSAYESRNKKDDKLPFLRGINDIQLWYDGSRWWVVNIMWQPETKDYPIPKEYIED